MCADFVEPQNNPKSGDQPTRAAVSASIRHSTGHFFGVVLKLDRGRIAMEDKG